MSVRQYLQRPNLARFPFVFIVTFGRSGSTLLQGILNSINGYDIRGENYSTLFALFIAAQQHARSHQHVDVNTDARHPWYGADMLNPKAFSQGLADLFLAECLQPHKETRCTGFKEIRYTPEHMPDEIFSEYLEFLQTVFPRAALIFNIRNISKTIDSGWWASLDQGPTKRQLDETVERFTSYAAGRTNCFVFNYDLLMEDSAYCETLFDFLGETLDLDRLKALLAQAHSYQAPRRANLLETIEAKSAELTNKEIELFRMRHRADRLEGLILEMRNSTSWKATTLIRRIQPVMRKLFRRTHK